jgi:hypothetical protein
MTGRRRTKPIPRDSGLRPPRISRRAARRLGVALLWVGTCAGLAYGLRCLDAYALETFADASWSPRIIFSPGTTEEWVVYEATDTAGLSQDGPLSTSKITDPQLCRLTAERVRTSPWVASVERVTKQPDMVNVYTSFRSFLTFVVHGGKGYLVDEEGYRLPREETVDRLARYEMILLEGAQEAPPPLGQAWTSEPVKKGLKLVKLLQTYCPSGPKMWIRAVDVSNYGGCKNPLNAWLSIRTVHARTRIEWGHPAGEEYDTEPPFNKKLAYMQNAFSRYGEFPDGKIFDLRDCNDLLEYDAP